MITHQLNLDEQSLQWPVDTKAAGKIAKWVKRKPAVFQADLQGMAEYFPHWYLTGGVQDKPKACSDCRLPIVPTDGAMRCPQCGTSQAVDSLLWLGQLPVLVHSAQKIAKKLQKLKTAGFATLDIQGGTYLLTPLIFQYPTQWPNQQPTVRYAPRWLKALGLPVSSGAHHLLGQGKACIFMYNDWQAMPVHSVLQQRVVNHAHSLLKVAAGLSPTKAFIGQGHHTTPPEG